MNAIETLGRTVRELPALVNAALILGVAIIIAASIAMYASPYQSCVRNVTGQKFTQQDGTVRTVSAAGAARICSRHLGGNG